MAKALRTIAIEDDKATGINNYYPILGDSNSNQKMTVLLEVIGFMMNIVGKHYK